MVIWNCYERDQQGSNISLEELSRSYISTGDDIEELGHLTELRVLDIAGYFRALALSECLRKLQKLQNLSIHIQEIDDVNGWVGPQNLRSLQVDGCWFRKLPVWINHSHVQNLSFLRLAPSEPSIPPPTPYRGRGKSFPTVLSHSEIFKFQNMIEIKNKITIFL